MVSFTIRSRFPAASPTASLSASRSRRSCQLLRLLASARNAGIGDAALSADQKAKTAGVALLRTWDRNKLLDDYIRRLSNTCPMGISNLVRCIRSFDLPRWASIRRGIDTEGAPRT